MLYIRKNQILGSNQHYRYHSFDYFLACQKELGMKDLEIWGGSPHVLLDCYGIHEVEVLKKKIETEGMKVRVFAPECIQTQFTFGAYDPLISQKVDDYYHNAISAAAKLGAEVMVIAVAGAAWNEELDIAYGRVITRMKKLMKTAQLHEMRVAVKTLPGREAKMLNSLDQIRRFISDVDHPLLQVCLDLTSVEMAGETTDKWFSVFGSRIGHVHFCDGRPLGRLVWGDGLRSIEDELAVLHRYNYQGYLSCTVPDYRYIYHPYEADQRNLRVLNSFAK